LLKLALTSLALLLSGGSTADAQESKATVAHSCPGLVQGVYYYRDHTRYWEHKLNYSPSKSNFNASLIHSCAYTKWVAHRWMKRSSKLRTKYNAWLQEQKRLQRLLLSDPKAAICSVFGPYCSQAIDVAICEGGLSPNAHNGQYLGTFQMGEHERGTYGHGNTVYEQAKAAYRYFVASGKDWSPWQCKPW